MAAPRLARRQLFGVISAALLAGTMWAPAASAKAGGVELMTGTTATVTAGTDAWVALNWAAAEDLSDFRVVAKNPPSGVTVSYPENTASWTGLAGGHMLDTDEVDFSALKISVAPDVTKDVKLTVTASYVVGGKAQSGNFKVTVPVTQFTGDVDLTQTTDAAQVAASGSWVSVAFAGHAPASDSFSMVVSAPSGVVITYPGGGTATSLDADNRLSAGETDVARAFVEPGAATSFELAVTATYDAGQGPKTVPGTVTITVAP